MPIRSRTSPRRAAEPPPPAYRLGGDLLDLNVWLALVVEGHSHHELARRYWRTEGASVHAIHFCRVTMLGFLRLLTQPKLMGSAACSAPEAAERYLSLLSLPEIEMTPEPADCEDILLGYVRQPWFVPRLWTDAYLAAFAVSGGLRLVTFDTDFARFGELQRLHLA